VQQHSEHRDAARAGDFGTWSTLAPTPYPREIETLASLEVGEVAPPRDTLFGYQVIRRMPDRPRREFAMVRLQLRFDPAAPDAEPSSKASVSKQANALAEKIRRDPSHFDVWQKENCCLQIDRVVEGTNVPALEVALAQLEPGEIAPEPIEGNLEYLIAKRLELSALPSLPATRFDLPAPAEPDVLYYLSHGREEQLRRVGQEAIIELGLTSETEREFVKRHDIEGQFATRSVSERIDLLEQTNADIERLVGPDTYRRYRAIVNRHFEELLLRL
jgi:hypothetical protein